jgi:uncharacterized MAPEG superfamily protein
MRCVGFVAVINPPSQPRRSVTANASANGRFRAFAFDVCAETICRASGDRRKWQVQPEGEASNNSLDTTTSTQRHQLSGINIGGTDPMTADLKILVWSVVLTFAQVVVAVLAAQGQIGLATLAGNREGVVTLGGLAGRAQRAHRNMLESLPLFIALILVAQVAGKTNAMTLLGAQLFFWGRLAHWLIYLAGIPWLRTLAWVVSVVGLILIFQQLW